MEISRYFKLLSDIDRARSIEDFRVLCEEFCSIVNVQHYLLVILDQVPLCTPEIKYLSSLPGGKIKSTFQGYSSDALNHLSPLVHYLIGSQAPVRWREAIANEDFGSIDYPRLVAQFNALGLTDGFSIPIKSASGEVVIFNMALDEGSLGDASSSSEALDQALPLAHTFTAYMLSRLIKISCEKGKTKNKLTPRELDCLFWACEGKTAWEIAKIIDVSERTVLFHLNNCARKLSACNRQHAVALATSKGIVKPDISRLKVSSQFMVA